MTLAPGARVRARASDPAHHTRVPRYVRGHTGEVVEYEGDFPLPDDRARGIDPPRVESVYAVRFPAVALWGEGSHTVTVDLWESYLEEVPPQAPGPVPPSARLGAAGTTQRSASWRACGATHREEAEGRQANER